MPAAAPPRPLAVAVTGASGFVGRSLVAGFAARGHSVVAMSRSPRAEAGARVRWAVYDPASAESCRSAVEGCDAVVHLAGDGLFDGRWGAAKIARIRTSRVDATRALVEGIASCAKRPEVLVSASAIGYYGPREPGEELGEDASPGSDFLSGVCREWEAAARGAEAKGVRVVLARLGIVLGRGGGALAKMLPPFKGFAGGPVAGGAQAMSWIHMDDLVALLVSTVEDSGWKGPVNATAPGAVSNREFSKALGKALHRPSFFPTPGWLMRVLLGKAAAILTTGQRVVPRAALARGFRFRFPEAGAALEDLVGSGAAKEPPAGEPRPARRVYALERRTVVPVPPDRAFAFFSDARNLARVTPPGMRFRIATEGAGALSEGAVIEFRVRAGLLPVRWSSRIEGFRPPHGFVDVMLRGPFRSWRHLHTFEGRGDGTVLCDLVEYSMPLGPLGRVAHALWVRRQVEASFDFRRDAATAALSAGGGLPRGDSRGAPAS